MKRNGFVIVMGLIALAAFVFKHPAPVQTQDTVKVNHSAPLRANK